jgi:hypothetical protein
MWEAIAKILTNQNALMVMIFSVIVFFILVILAKMGWIRLNTSKFGLGDDYRERDIIRQQTEWAHIYCVGLKHQIDDMCKNVEGYDPYITMYVLERMYSEVVEWITYNHLNLTSEYVSIKQEKVKGLVSTLTIMPEVFTSKKFYAHVDEWTSEIITKLVKIREVYK